MVEVVSKKYTQALIESSSDTELDSVLATLKELSKVFEDDVSADILESPFLNKGQKEEIILSALQPSSGKLINFIKLLNLNNRLSLIPYIAVDLEKKMLAKKKEFVATLISKDKLDDATLDKIQKSLAQKLGVKLSIKQEISDIDGIKLGVDDLGVEVSFSKNRFADDLKHHILKAI